MPTIETYTYAYVLGTTAPDATTVYPVPDGPGSVTVEDSEDSTADGFTAVGDNALLNSPLLVPFPVTAQLYGFTSSGDPVFFEPLTGNCAIVSNNPSLTGNIGFTTTGTYAYCFAEGTEIMTDAGGKPVEQLKIGHMVTTADGTLAPVKWIGRQTVSTRFGPAERLMPVRFAAGSLGDGLPHSDLTVTADHGMLVDGVICHAGALVNGTTITRVPLAEMGETYTVYHIETEEHEIILANGAPAETFIDNVSRRVFDNYAEFEALYGDVPEMEELPYPRAMSARQVPGHIRARLAAPKVA
ncbi:Hint domain-containing protein [Nioella aestuarii]|uniref:Hint domain-containing protein n=1 Tax=Nioella aestuarii TaxID=1662864 RepID=UPI003D7F40D9